MYERRREARGHEGSAQARGRGWPGKRTLTQALPIQKRAAGAASVEAVGETASAGVAGAGGALPHADRIQSAFGKHDISSVRAHVGGAAAQAAQAIGAVAYATGSDVAFASPPDLHTAAHEAAHVVQQRGGVSLKGGVGEAGDPYERHADAVADAVVAGRSAEGLLDQMAGGGGGGAAVQRLPAEPAPAAATPVPGAPPEVVAKIGSIIVGEGGFQYLVLPTATFEVIVTPPSATKAMHRELRPDNEFAAAWKTICDQIVAQAPKPAAPAEQTPAAPADAGPSLGTLIVDGLTGVAETLLTPVTTIGGMLSDFFFGEDETGAPGPGQTPGAPAPGDEAARQREELLAGGKTDNLDTAERLKDEISLGYSLETQARAGETAGQMATRVRTAIISGDPSQLDSLNCGQFTALTLAESGFDLNMEYVDPKSGFPVAYKEGDGKLTFVTAWMLVNNQPEAVGAIIDVQAGGATQIKAGSEEAKALKLSKNNGKVKLQDGTMPPACEEPASRSVDFMVSDKKTFVGMKADASHDFGAGAVAVLFGGKDVALPDRRPGDIQQRIATKSDGTYHWSGHSSTIHTVQGPGVCKLIPGDATSPKPVGVSADGKADGWYEGTWEVGPDTAPELVSRLTVTKVQLIDANYDDEKGADGRDQAIAVGKMKDATTFDAAKTSQVESSGRLPTSRWISWQGSFPDAANPAKLS